MTIESTAYRRSETMEQQQHEEATYTIPNKHFNEADLLIEEKPADGAPSTFKLRMKNLARKYNPISPTAKADIRIMKNTFHLERELKKDMRDVERFPEVEKVAEVRRGLDLCAGESAYLERRKLHMREHFAKYLGLDSREVEPEDVPVVSFGGSGGGFRAMLGVVGYCDEMQRAGLWDLLTYVSGVSGACWSLASYYTYGGCSWETVTRHCKKRLSPYHPLSQDAVRTVLSAPDGAHITLGPLMLKHHSGLQTVAMDLYSVFTTGYVWLHGDPIQKPGEHARSPVTGFHRDWFKWTNALRYIDDGSQPLPIMTAIRHERPWRDWADKEHPFSEPDHAEEQHQDAKDAWFQWFEITPYEVGCDELEAWVPTWAFGRPFSEGKSTMQLPEQSLALLIGLCVSAPAGPLTSYLATINRNLPKGFIGDQIHALAAGVAKMWGKHGTEQFENHHPLHACNEHNFMFHLTHVDKGQPRPPGLENSPRIHLIDSGMDNNCPTQVLLHPNREVDVIINMDASSDVQKDTFQERVDQIGGRRGLKFTRRHDLKAGTDPDDPDRFQGLYAQIYDGVLAERPPTVIDSYGNTVTTPPSPVVHQDCTMVYMPLLPNGRAVPDFDPSTAKFSGSYNLVWTPEQVEMLVKVCVQNYQDGEATIKTALREAWQRKKAVRLCGHTRREDDREMLPTQLDRERMPVEALRERLAAQQMSARVPELGQPHYATLPMRNSTNKGNEISRQTG